MKRGRNTIDMPKIGEPDLDQDRIDNAMEEARQESRAVSLVESQHAAAVRAVAAQVGYQLPADCVDPDLIQRDIAANMRRSVEACLEVGRGLTVLKSACEHGNFVARLEVLGLDRTVAVRFMQAALKFSNVATSQHLTQAIGTQSKLFEMLVLDDEQIEELALTGETGELKLDDVATMSVKELRTAVRELKGEVEAQTELLRDKNAKLDDLRAKAKRIALVPSDTVLDELRKETTAIFNDARGAVIGQLRQAMVCIRQHHDDHGGDSTLFQAGLVAQLQADLNTLRDEFGLPDVSAAAVPEWIGQVSQQGGE